MQKRMKSLLVKETQEHRSNFRDVQPKFLIMNRGKAFIIIITGSNYRSTQFFFILLDAFWYLKMLPIFLRVFFSRLCPTKMIFTIYPASMYQLHYTL